MYAYDAAGNQTLSEAYQWENNGWKGRSKYTYAYDDRGVQTFSGEHNWTNNQWVKSREDYYDRKAVNSNVYVTVSLRYNEDGSRLGDLLFVENSGLNGAYFVSPESKMEYKATYDSNDNPTLVETTVLRDGKRVPNNRYVLKYSKNNPVSSEVYSYNGKDIGQMYLKANNTYDAGGNRTLSESYDWDWDSNKWTGIARSVSTYDTNRNETLYKHYKWNTSSGSWMESSKSVIAHDANGNQTLYEHYNWDTSSGKWIGDRKYVQAYDAYGHNTLYVYYRWDTSSGSWIWSSKTVYAYDAYGNETLYESYSWDTSSGDWIGSSKTVYEKNGYGQEMLSKSYVWNNGWECTSYTVSYPESGYPDGTERIGEAEALAYIHGDVLHIQTVQAERITIYTLNGSKVYEGTVPAGATALSAGRLPKGVLIVRGGSGWTGKVIR
ncbi:MAG: DUF3836 domain-containing protein [Tannerella sp.]|nr:DUF3836 domain-containing protein [Tannerella sp.]